MRRFRAAVLLCSLIAVVPVSAAELPARKDGLWEMKTTILKGHTVSIQQCVDAKTDQAMQSSAGAVSQRDCSKRDVQTSGGTTTVDSVCTVAGKTRTAHMVITGSFDSDYTMVITSQGEGGQAPRTVTIASKWLGPCGPDQKPGDTIMPNGVKLNLLDLRNGLKLPGASPQH